MRLSPHVRTIGLAISIGAAGLACFGSSGPGGAAESAGRLVKFVQTGDTLLLSGVFSDSVLSLLSIAQMLTTRDEFLAQFGDLDQVDGPTFDTDTTASVVLRYERMNLLASLEFDSQGAIRHLAIQPEPVASAGESPPDSGLTDVKDEEVLRLAFNADSQYVRLVTILSPT